jgi:four helix bundle protein
MSQLEIKVPAQFPFYIEIPIRRIDLSLDLHVSFATILDLVMEAHLQFLQNYGFSPTDIYGKSVIFANASVIYQGELLSKDKVRIEVAPENFFEKGFDYIFRLTKQDGTIPVAQVKIRVLFFDYTVKKVSAVPIEFKFLFVTPKTQSNPVNSNNSMAWKEAHTLVIKIYNFTKNFPKEEADNLTARIRKSAISLPLCIMEGSTRKQKEDLSRFLGKCRGYIEEIKYYLILSQDLGYGNSNSLIEELESLNLLNRKL